MGWYEMFGFVFRITWLPALCFVLGFAFIIFELFHPGFGAPGISGIILLILGIMFTARSLLDAIVMVLIILIIVGILLFLVIRSASRGKLNKKLILSEQLGRESGYISGNKHESFLNKKGVAITMLRPSGIIDVEGIRLDVVTDGEYLSKGTKVEVIKIEGMRIVVAEAKEEK